MQGDRAALRDHERIGRFLAGLIGADPRITGKVLDVGCGSGPSIAAYRDVYQRAGQIDGVDPSPAVHQYAAATRRWEGDLDKVPVPQGEYDAAVSINVVEHVADPAVFLSQAFRVLKPGGRFYAVTPSGAHPFAWCVRLVQALGLKKRMIEGHADWNEYPAFYRLNTRGAVLRFAGAAGFGSVTFIHHPNPQWEGYFPAGLRFVPRTYDWLLGDRVRTLGQIFMFVLEKPGTWAAPAPASSPPPSSASMPAPATSGASGGSRS